MLGLAAMPVVAKADTLLEKIATTVIADYFGIDTREVIYVREQSGRSVYDMAPIYEGAYYFKRSPQTIYQLRNEGLGWGQIAQRCGMHPGTFNKLRKEGKFDRDRFWTTAYSQRFGTTPDRIDVIRKRGGTLEDVLGAVVIGKLTNRDPGTVYDRYQTDRSWSKVSGAYDVRFEDWRRVSAPVRTYLPISGSSKGKSAASTKDKTSKGKTTGQSKAKGSVKSKGKADKGKTAGKSQTKGQGNSKAKSGGPAKAKGNGGGNGKGNGKGNA